MNKKNPKFEFYQQYFIILTKKNHLYITIGKETPSRDKDSTKIIYYNIIRKEGPLGLTIVLPKKYTILKKIVILKCYIRKEVVSAKQEGFSLLQK